MKITGRKSANHAGSEIGWVSTLHFSLTVYLWRCTARKTKNASEMVSMISLQWPSSFSGAGKNHPQGWWINTPVKRNHFQAPKLEGPGIMIFWKSSFKDMIRIYILYKYVWYIWIIYQNTIISRRTFVQFSASRLPPLSAGPLYRRFAFVQRASLTWPVDTNVPSPSIPVLSLTPWVTWKTSSGWDRPLSMPWLVGTKINISLGFSENPQGHGTPSVDKNP